MGACLALESCLPRLRVATASHEELRAEIPAVRNSQMPPGPGCKLAWLSTHNGSRTPTAATQWSCVLALARQLTAHVCLALRQKLFVVLLGLLFDPLSCRLNSLLGLSHKGDDKASRERVGGSDGRWPGLVAEPAPTCDSRGRPMEPASQTVRPRRRTTTRTPWPEERPHGPVGKAAAQLNAQCAQRLDGGKQSTGQSTPCGGRARRARWPRQ